MGYREVAWELSPDKEETSRETPTRGERGFLLPEVELKFASDPKLTFVEAYRLGELSATVRLNDGKGIKPFTRMNLLEADTGEKFGQGVVLYAQTMPISDVLDVIIEHDAVYKYNTEGALIEALKGYYNCLLDRSSKVKLIMVEPEELISGKYW